MRTMELPNEEIRAGYSPKPARDLTAQDTTSPSSSVDPETLSPHALTEEPDLSVRQSTTPDKNDFSMVDGIVTFAK